jgi:hypothetical protein
MRHVKYGEERSINIGDFESVRVFLEISDDIHAFNNENAVYRIRESKAATVDEHRGDVKNTAKLLIQEVRGILDKRETEIRLWADNFVTFNHQDKLPGVRKV